MATAELKVRIEAEIAQFKKGLDKANKDLTGFSGKVTADLKRTATEAAKASASLGGAVAKGSNQASFALTNLGRVAQDAPFGFIGIQNNIPPLIEAFTRLKATSGGTGGALKALGASLIGSGGLLFAVSLVTSALTVLASNPEKVAGAINYLSGVIDDATESQKAYNKELIETGASAKVEITSLTGLIAIARNETLSRNARLEALKKVKAEYPEQLNFLTLETIGSKRASDAIDLLSKSLLRKAKIQAAEKLLGDAFVKQLEATTKTAAEQASTFSKVVGASLGAIGIKNFVVLQNGIENQAKAFNDAGKDITTYTDILKKLTTQEAEAGTLFDDPIKTTPKFNRDSSIKLFKQFKTVIGDTRKQIQSDLTTNPLIDITTLLGGSGFTPDNIGKQLYTPFEIFKDEIQFDLLPQLGTSFKTFFDDMLMNGKFSFASLGESIKNTFLSVLASEATQGILNLLGAKGKDGKGKGLIGSVLGLIGGGKKGAVSDVGSEVVKKGLGGILGTILPAAGLAFGAISVLGGLFKKKSIAPQPAFTTSNAISTSSSSNVDFGSGRVVFEISGVNLVGVLNRAGAKLQRFGP